MTEITQADRDAAAQYDVVEAFARHRKYGYDQGYYDGRQMDRTEERAAIVAWLREQGITEDENKSQNGWWDTSTGALYGASILEAIEQGKHLK